jgi:hypothetical protein
MVGGIETEIQVPWRAFRAACAQGLPVTITAPSGDQLLVVTTNILFARPRADG